MRHAKSWRKNQSGDDALDRPFETSTTITNITHPIFLRTLLLQFLSLSTKDRFGKLETFFYFRRTTDCSIIIFRIIDHPRRQQPSPSFLLFLSEVFSIGKSLLVMQPLSNDTGSWSLIDAPLPSPLFYNSNTYDTIGSIVSGVIGDFRNPLPPLTFDLLSTNAPQSLTLRSSSSELLGLLTCILPSIHHFRQCTRSR